MQIRHARGLLYPLASLWRIQNRRRTGKLHCSRIDTIYSVSSIRISSAMMLLSRTTFAINIVKHCDGRVDPRHRLLVFIFFLQQLVHLGDR